MIKLTNIIKEWGDDDDDYVDPKDTQLQSLVGKTIKKIENKYGLGIIFEDGTKFEAFVQDQGDTSLTYNIE